MLKVADLKVKIEEEKGASFPADGQRLIYSGSAARAPSLGAARVDEN